MKLKIFVKAVLLATVLAIVTPTATAFAIDYSVDGKPMASNKAALFKEEWKTANLLNNPPSEPNAVVVDYKITLDGKQVTLDEPILSFDGRTYLPLRALADIIGATTEYDGDNGIAIVEINGKTVETFSGSNKIIVNGSEIKDIDTANPNARAFLRSTTNKTYLPLRAAVEAFGYAAEWDSASKTINITSPGYTPLVTSETPVPGKPVPNLPGFTYDQDGWPRDAEGYDPDGYNYKGVNREGKHWSQVKWESMSEAEKQERSSKFDRN